MIKNLKRRGDELRFSRWVQSHHRSSYERRKRQKSQRFEDTTLLALKMEEGAISHGIKESGGLWKSEKARRCSESRSAVSDSLRAHGLYSPWNSPGQNTGVGSLSLLQGIFPTQGLNPSLPPRTSRRNAAL